MEENNLNNMEPPASPSMDSDYGTDMEADTAPSEPVEMTAADDPLLAVVPQADEWIDLDLPAEFSNSLGFLTDGDFQDILASFSEFTNRQLRAANYTSMELLKELLRDHLAFLLWRRTILGRFRHLLPVQLEGEQLDRLLNDQWIEGSQLMIENRQRFSLLADATAVPQVVLTTILSYCRKRRADDDENELILPADGGRPEKRRRHN